MYNDNETCLNDADIEMNELQVTANRHERLAAKGICVHGWFGKGPNNTYVCKNCGQSFPSEEAALQAYEEYL